MAWQLSFRVTDSSEIGVVRRAAVQLATAAGLGETECGRVALIATELGGNLVRHAQEGEVLLQELRGATGAVIELLALDRGPGMANPERSMRDGFSTGGTPGTGLGAVRRLSSDFDLHSVQGIGTVVLSRVWSACTSSPAPGRPPFEWGVVNQPFPGETVCGDVWVLKEQEDEGALMIADGLGHGILAFEAARTAATIFETHAFGGMASFLERSNAVMRSTRGAAIASARFSGTADRITYAGLGNIAGYIVSPDGTSRGLMSHNGTVGAETRRARELEYVWKGGDLLVMHSDGLKHRWSGAERPGLFARHPAVIAATMYRDFRRTGDDVTVVVVRRGR